MTNFLSESANLEHLASLIPGNDRDLFNSFGHCQFEAAFKDRLFVLFQPSGLNPDNTHRAPEVLTMLKVLAFDAEAEYGAEVLIYDTQTGNEQWVGHTPARLFDYKVFMQVPPYLHLKWDAVRDRNGAVRRSLSFGLLIKTANRSDFYSAGNTYCLPPNKFRALYPDYNLRLA